MDKNSIDNYNFYLPEELIAQHALEPRDSSKLMVINKIDKTIEDKKFHNIIEYLSNNDILVINRTKVIPARLYGYKENGVKIECLLLKRISLKRWEVLLKPAKKFKFNDKLIILKNVLEAKLIEIKEDGNRIIEFEYEGNFEEILIKIGEMPLPPYIKEKLKDNNRYQTVYAKSGESVAAPTAGLHFTNELLEKIKEKGVTIVEIYLTVGLGTFRPVQVNDIRDHIMHSEEYEIPIETANIINEGKKQGKRIIAVGTTTVRTLESSVDEDGLLIPKKDSTNIFIFGEYNFKIINALITNFHLPKSTLLMLVSSFANKKLILEAYNKAVERKYRFFSFGDSMFIY